MKNKVPEEKHPIDEELSPGLLRSMMQETLEVRSLESPSDSSSTSSSIPDQDHFGSIGRNLAYNLKNPWESILRENASVFFLHAILMNYNKLSDLSNGRSYFSLLAIHAPKSVWIHHLTRDLVDGLASIIRARRMGNTMGSVTNSGVDGAHYLEIGPFVNSVFRNVYEKSLGRAIRGKLKIRHLLCPGFHRWIHAEELYVVMNFSMESSQLSGSFQLAFPHRIQKSLIRE